MKRNKTDFIKNLFFTGVVGLALLVCSEQAYSLTDGVALLLQQSPAGAGQITPEEGVHHFAADSEVTLTAIPKQGYQFLYWIGDVIGSKKNSTIVHLDAPKIVIAVFERSTFQFSLGGGGNVLNIPAERTFRRAADYARGGISPVGKRPHKPSWPKPYEEQEEPPTPDFPVPEQPDDNDFPVPEPIPEPATSVMFLLGTLLVFARNRKKHQPI